jgi:hypothetical protein
MSNVCWRTQLAEPFSAEHRARSDTNVLHERKVYLLEDGQLPKLILLPQLTEDIIQRAYCVYTNFDEKRRDDKFWLCLEEAKRGMHFAFFSKCCGTGFGLGSKTELYLSKSYNDILDRALTDEMMQILTNQGPFQHNHIHLGANQFTQLHIQYSIRKQSPTICV